MQAVVAGVEGEESGEQVAAEAEHRRPDGELERAEAVRPPAPPRALAARPAPCSRPAGDG
ncbi:MAG: hypothetical protein C0498_02295 [Anaerolinea sp.]|nr:hypothetical protein [Anaerolinea sp.]